MRNDKQKRHREVLKRARCHAKHSTLSAHKCGGSAASGALRGLRWRRSVSFSAGMFRGLPQPRPGAGCAFFAPVRFAQTRERRFSNAPRRSPNHATRQQSAVTFRAAFRPPLICCACSASWESGEASRSAGMLDRSFGASLARLVQRRVLFALSLRCSANRSGLIPRRIDLGDVGRFSPLFAPTPFSRGRVLLSAQ